MAFEGIAVIYYWSLRSLNDSQLGLSSINWVAYFVSPILFEPILLFGALYYTGVTMDRDLPLLQLLPGLALAVLVGGVIGQFIGLDITPTAAPIVFLKNSDFLALSPQLVIYWRDVLAPLVRAFLTVVAALGLAEATK